MSEQAKARVMAIELLFDLGSKVYIKHDPHQQARMVTSVQISMGASVLYLVSCGIVNSWHHAAELMKEREFINEHKQEE